MFWIAVNGSGKGKIFQSKPIRNCDYSYWYTPMLESFGISNECIEKLNGKALVWEDEPICIGFLENQRINVGNLVETCQLLPGIVTETKGDDVTVFTIGKHTSEDGLGGYHSIKHCDVHKITDTYAIKLLAIGEKKLNKLFKKAKDVNLPWSEIVERYYFEHIN